jgi:hypothetical protein
MLSWLRHSRCYNQPLAQQLKRASRQTRSHPSERATEVKCTIVVTHVACLDVRGLSAQFSGTVKTAHGEAIPRSACVPSGISDTRVSAAKCARDKDGLAERPA